MIGSSYEGGWLYDMYQGKGVFTYPDKTTKVTGMFEKNELVSGTF